MLFVPMTHEAEWAFKETQCSSSLCLLNSYDHQIYSTFLMVVLTLVMLLCYLYILEIFVNYNTRVLCVY